MGTKHDWSMWADIAERVGTWVIAVSGTVALLWKRICRLLAGISAGDGLHREFGPDAASQIRSLLERVARSTDEMQVRQKLAERHLGIGIYICTPDGRVSWCNEHLCEMFGLSQEGVQGHKWLKAVHDNDSKRVFEEWDFAVTHGLPYRSKYKVVNQMTSEEWTAKAEAFAVTKGKGLVEVVFYVGYVVKAEERE